MEVKPETNLDIVMSSVSKTKKSKKQPKLLVIEDEDQDNSVNIIKEDDIINEETYITQYNNCEKLYNKNVDLNTLYNDKNGLKYLLIRSFSKEDFINFDKTFDKKKSIDKLRLQTFIQKNIQEIICYIISKKTPLEKEYVNMLSSELSTMCLQSSSVHQDDFNSNMNKIIRNIEISTYSKLQTEIDNKLLKQLKNYMTWQWYNQKCSDLIENIILTQENIIQTPRKIKNIDFFVNFGNNYIFPFDLKLTIFPAGFMKDEKILNNKEIIQAYIGEKDNHIKILKWLYSEQNPRLFSNNYRYFIILLNLDDTNNSYKLKCNIELIKQNAENFFKNITQNDIIDIEYEYKKDKSKSGTYNTKCIYTIIYI